MVRTNDIDAFWTYDGEGKVTSAQYPVVNGSGGTTYPYSYDTMSRLTGVTTWRRERSTTQRIN